MTEEVKVESKPVENKVDLGAEEVQEYVKKEKESLISKNYDLIGRMDKYKGENAALKSKISSLGGDEGIEKLLNQKEVIENQSITDLTDEKKYNEALEAMDKKRKSHYEGVISELTSKFNNELAAKEKRLVILDRERVDKTLLEATRRACEKMDAKSSSYRDVFLHIKNNFTLDDDNNIVSYDKDNEVKRSMDGVNGNYSIENFIKDSRADHAHWFKESVGSNSTGSSYNIDGYEIKSMGPKKSRMSNRQRQWRIDNGIDK